MIYKLEDGTRVRLTNTADGVDYEVYHFEPEKVVTETGRMTGEQASTYRSALVLADALRFARQYGGRPLVNRN